MDIKKGIRWLDKHAPANWRELIDVDELDLRDGNKCVLSQVFNENYDNLCPRMKLRHNRCLECGFMAKNNDSLASANLTSEWKRYLTQPVPERKFKVGQQVYVVSMNHDAFNIIGHLTINKIETTETENGTHVRYFNRYNEARNPAELYASHKEAYDVWVKLHKS